MNEQQKQAVEESLSIYRKESLNINPDIEGAYEIGFGEGLVEVINNPQRYGLQPINEWVSVKDRLPNKAELILAYQNGEIYTSFYDGLFRVGFTHWQPLPPIPDVEPK